MASSIKAPEAFNFQQPEEFQKWIRRFDRYLQAANLTSAARKTSTLVYCLGPQAEDVLSTFNLTAQQQNDYDVVRTNFLRYFNVRKNVIFERARFNLRMQQEGESAEQFIMNLYQLIEHCEYGAMTDELLRDKIVIGILDKELSKKLQLDDQLTLEKALTQVRSKELVQKQSDLLRTDPVARADAVKSANPRRRQNTHTRNKREQRDHQKSCTRCGREAHKIKNCPAKDATCKKCHRKGHWHQHCMTKMTSLKEVEQDSDDDEHFMGTISSIGELSKHDDYTIQLGMHDGHVTFKIDSGADVSAISPRDHKRVASNVALQKPDRILCSAGGQQLAVLGKFQAELKNSNGDSTVTDVYVVNKLKTPLLGKPAIRGLNLLKRVNAVTDSEQFKAKVMADFPKLFTGLGEMQGEYKIELKPNSKPHAVNAPRRIALPMLKGVKAALEKMEEQGVIRKLGPNETSPYLSPIVTVLKSNGKVRVCVDYTELNKNVMRPYYELPTVDDTLVQFGKGSVFSKLDANSGYFQIKLAKESQLLTSFITPFGRYCSMRLPFGITSGPECFQYKVNTIIDGLDNTACLMDDIAVASSDAQSHEQQLYAVLRKLQEAGVTLNPEKCEFMKPAITFVGHTITKSGISADPEKVRAITDMPQPQDVSDVRRFNGMINQLGKFSSRLAELSAPLRALMSDKNAWYWGPAQQAAFEAVKQEICSPRVLAAYSPNHETKIRSDSSKNGYGAVLLQRESAQQEFKPVCYASKALTSAEQNYSIIEKEAGAIVFACTKFEKYILGMENVRIETDQKPLVSLLGSKAVNALPPRITRFRLALMRFNYTIAHVPGKEMYMSDCLSRASVKDSTSNVLTQECEAYVNALLSNMPCTDRRLEQLKELQHDDEICIQLMQYIKDGWPEASDIKTVLKPYYQFRHEMSVCNGILLKSDRIVVPTAMRLEMLDLLHVGHLGISKCHQRALSSVWWPGLSKQIEHMVKNCATCARNAPDQAEPLMTTPLPDRPFQKVAMDICDIKGKKYLVLVDYYSKFIEFAHLRDMTIPVVISHVKSIMSRHGIFETLVSDNQFATSEMAQFSADYGFTHVTSSPRYARSNGCAENAVKQFKLLMKKNDDPYLALLTYRTTPQHNGLSPSEMCMGRRLRTQLPQAPHMLLPANRDTHVRIREKDEIYKHKMAVNYNRRHRARDLPPLQQGDRVVIRDQNQQGIVQQPAINAPRSYVVKTPTSDIRRNRRALIKLPDATAANNQSLPADSTEHNKARPARMRHQPQRYGDYIPWKAL